jgi:hypothetical protein
MSRAARASGYTGKNKKRIKENEREGSVTSLNRETQTPQMADR